MDTFAITKPVFRHSSGLLSDLEKTITPQEVRRLERLGYIENAVSPKGETWRLSSKGKSARKSLLQDEHSIWDVLSDFFYNNVLKFRVSI